MSASRYLDMIMGSSDVFGKVRPPAAGCSSPGAKKKAGARWMLRNSYARTISGYAASTISRQPFAVDFNASRLDHTVHATTHPASQAGAAFDLGHLGTGYQTPSMLSGIQCAVTKVVSHQPRHGNFRCDRIDQGVEMLRYHAGKVPCTKALLKKSNWWFQFFTVPVSLECKTTSLTRELPGREWCCWCWGLDCCRLFLNSFLRLR